MADPATAGKIFSDEAAKYLPQINGFWGGLIGTIFFGFVGLMKFRNFFTNPLSVDLKHHLEKPDYKGRSSFIEDFHKDFKNIVTAYAGEDKYRKKKGQDGRELKDKKGQSILEQTTKERKVFVFIDDLDRCDVPRAADLMQSLNLMISDAPQLFFIIGMDREKVAAGLAVKYEKLLPYMSAAATATNVFDPLTGLEYGYAFIEKFIQVPFKVPQPSEDNIKNLIDAVGGESASEENPVVPAGSSENQATDSVIIELESDSQVVKEIVKMVAPTFDYNPRRIKQFLNLFRLKAYIASQTGLFARPFKSETDKTEYKTLTLEKLGKFVALTLRYPLLIADLDDHPGLLSELQIYAWDSRYREFDAITQRWTKTKILELLRKGFEKLAPEEKDAAEPWEPEIDSAERCRFSLTEVNVSKLLQVSPAKQRTKAERNALWEKIENLMAESDTTEIFKSPKPPIKERAKPTNPAYDVKWKQ